MKRHLAIITERIDEAALISQRRMSNRMGGGGYLLGGGRGREEGESIKGIEYEAFQRMVEHQFNLLFDDMEKRWPIESVRVVHRVGVVKVNEASLWVEVITPHR